MKKIYSAFVVVGLLCFAQVGRASTVSGEMGNDALNASDGENTEVPAASGAPGPSVSSLSWSTTVTVHGWHNCQGTKDKSFDNARADCFKNNKSIVDAKWERRCDYPNFLEKLSGLTDTTSFSKLSYKCGTARIPKSYVDSFHGELDNPALIDKQERAIVDCADLKFDLSRANDAGERQKVMDDYKWIQHIDFAQCRNGLN